MRKLFHELAKPARNRRRVEQLLMKTTTGNNFNNNDMFLGGKMMEQQRQQQLQQQIRHHHPDPRDLKYMTKGWKAALKEKTIPESVHEASVKRELKLGLQGSSSINDKTIPTFSRGELPHFAGINTFMKAPYCEDI